MRSIIYGARHRPLNIPRSTKESSRYPGIIPGQYSRIVTEVRARAIRIAPLFSRAPNGVKRKAGSNPVGEAPVAAEESFLRRDRFPVRSIARCRPLPSRDKATRAPYLITFKINFTATGLTSPLQKTYRDLSRPRGLSVDEMWRGVLLPRSSPSINRA